MFSAGRGLHGRACWSSVGKGLAPPAALILKPWAEECSAFSCGAWLVCILSRGGRRGLWWAVFQPSEGPASHLYPHPDRDAQLLPLLWCH